MQSDLRSEELLEFEKLQSSQKQKAVPTKRKSVKRLQKFSDEELKMLIRAVKEHRCIWDLQSKYHCNVNVLNRSWNLVATAVGKEVNECKIAWTALRQSYRYRKKALKKKRSGSSGVTSLVSPILEEDENQWEFSKLLGFLQETSTKRSSFTSMPDVLVSNSSNTNESSSFAESQKSDACEPQKVQSKKSASTIDKKNAATLDLMKTQKSLISQSSAQIPHHHFWNYISDLTKDFNNSQMHDLQKEMLQLVFTKLEHSKSIVK